MSYTLQVWEQPLDSVFPKNSRETSEFVRKISLSKGEQNIKFKKLAEILVNSFPDYLMMLEEDEDASVEECAWTNVPLDGKTEYLVFNIGINIDMVDEVLYLVVKEAVKLGLSVFDFQSGDTWLSNGEKFSMEEIEEPSEKEELYKLVYNKMKKFFIINGYEPCKEDTSFLFRDSQSSNRIYIIPHDSKRDSFMIYVLGIEKTILINKKYIFDILKIQYEEMPIYKIVQSMWLKDKSCFLKQYGAYYQLEDYNKIDELIINLSENIEKKLFPILKECFNAEGIDKYLNHFNKLGVSPLKGSSGRGIEELIAAYSAKNPELKELCDKYEKIYIGKTDESSQIVLECISYLKNRLPNKQKEDKFSKKRYIQIWEQPSYKKYPQSIDEVIRYVKRIVNSNAEQNPKFIQFAEILKSKFPDYETVLKIDENFSAENCVWEDSVLNGKSEYEVYSLKVNPMNILDIKESVVKEARMLGLSVLFEEERSAYLGNGTEFEGSFEYESKYFATVPEVSYCGIMFYERIKPMLLANGFTSDDSSLCFKKELSNIKINMELRRYINTNWYTEFYLEISIIFYNSKKIDILWEELMKNEKEYFIGEFNSYQCKSYDSVDDISEHFKFKFQNIILPFFEKVNLVDDIVECMQLDDYKKNKWIKLNP